MELFLKGALRLVAVEPTRTHDVGDVLRREATRFPEARAQSEVHPRERLNDIDEGGVPATPGP